MPLPFALDHINLWLLREADGRWTAIDCGYGDAPTRALWERHFATTMAGAPIATVIATHYHPDHVGNADLARARFDAPIRMTQAEFLTAHAIHGQRRPTPRPTPARSSPRTASRAKPSTRSAPAATPTPAGARCRDLPPMLDGDRSAPAARPGA